VWYRKPDFLAVVTAAWNNFWIGVKYLTRTLIRGWEPWVSENILFAIFALIFAYLLILGKTRIVVIFFIFGAFLWLAIPIIADFVADTLAPGLMDVIDDIRSALPSWLDWIAWPFEQLLDLLTFPNATDDNPLGEPETGEFTCFFFNGASWLFGLGVFWILALFLGHLAVVGGFFGTWRCFQGVCCVCPRWGWGCFLCFVNFADSDARTQDEANQDRRTAQAIDTGVDYSYRDLKGDGEGVDDVGSSISSRGSSDNRRHRPRSVEKYKRRKDQ
jgi:hypothetical protein